MINSILSGDTLQYYIIFSFCFLVKSWKTDRNAPFLPLNCVYLGGCSGRCGTSTPLICWWATPYGNGATSGGWPIWIARERAWQRERQTDRQRERQTDRQRQRKEESEIETETETKSLAMRRKKWGIRQEDGRWKRGIIWSVWWCTSFLPPPGGAHADTTTTSCTFLKNSLLTS